MRILLNELKKIFMPRYIIVAAIIAALFISLYTREGLPLIYEYSNNVYANNCAFSPEPTDHWALNSRADNFRTFKWFTKKFGCKITDETIAEIDRMSYSELDEFIAGREEFTRMGIHDTAELYGYMENIHISEYFCSGYISDSVSGATEEERAMFESMALCVPDLYLDSYIARNDFLRENGVNSYADYNERVFALGGFDDEELHGAVIKEIGNAENVMRSEISTGKTVPAYDIIHEQWRQFTACSIIKRLYLETVKDPMYYFDLDSGYWMSSWEHTLSQYRNDWIERGQAAWIGLVGSEQFEMSDEEMRAFMYENRPQEEVERITGRVNALGENYFCVRPDELFNGWNGTGFGIVILSTVLCILFAAPYAVADKRGIVPLQYTSRCGRRIERKKLCAVMISAVLISAASSAAIMLIMPNDVCAQWFDLPVSSFVRHDLIWLDVTVWQYIGVYLAAALVINMSAAVIAYTVCGFCGNIISAVTVSVPFVIAAILLWLHPLSHIFSLPESAAETPLWCGCTAAAAVICAVMTIIKEKRAVI